MAKFYADTTNMVLAQFGAMDSVDGFMRSLRNRPVSTITSIMPLLNAIKYGKVAVPRSVRDKVVANLDKFESAMQGVMGRQRYAALINAYDAAKVPVLSPGSYLKSFVADRAAQLVPRASDLLRDIFNQPIKTRAEDVARQRRIEPLAKDLIEWRKN